MSVEGRSVPARGALRLSGAPGARRPGSPPLFAYVLDADDDLAQVLDVRMRFAARQLATARLLEAQVGECDLAPWLAAVGHGPGLLVLDGLVAVDTLVAERTVSELLGAGDLVQPAAGRVDEMVQRRETWHALSTTRFALLDEEFAERLRPWPQISQELLRRCERRAGDLAALRAICCQPRLEARLVLVLWHLAARWGRVERAGIRVSLPLTHRLLGQLVAAERPSVTHALRRLAQTGLVTGTPGDWHLHGTLQAQLRALADRSPCLPAQADAPQATGDRQIA